MEVRLITESSGLVVPRAALHGVLAEPDAFVWVDMPECDAESLAVLRDVFGFHAVALWEARERQRMPKFHPYADHVFVVLHAPVPGDRGHVHYVELDQFIGARYLVTVHGPTNPAVPAHVPLRDTSLVWERIEEGRFHPRSPVELSRALVASLCEGMEETLEAITDHVWTLEQHVTEGTMGEPEAFLDEMFRTRHGLLAVANVSATSAEIYERLVAVSRSLDDDGRALLADNIDQFRRVQQLADRQRDYLEGAIEFYRTIQETKMTIAAERLAVIAVVTLPITALASILGMNVIVNDRTEGYPLAAALVIMLAMSAVLLRWAKKQGWW